MKKSDEIVGVVRSVHYGNRDVGYPVLWFDVDLEDGFTCLQVFDGEEAEKIVADSGAYDVASIKDRACFMKRTGPNTTRFERWWK